MASGTTPGLLDLPETVVRNFLLPGLHPTDLLRLRHVHPVTRGWAANMSDSTILSAIWQKSKGHFLEIDGGKNSIHHLMTMRPPNPLHYSSRFFIQNYTWDLFNDPDFDKFLELCGPRIRHLHIQQYNLCRDPKELLFYNSLVNLTRLDIDIVEMQNMTQEHLTNADNYIPTATFGNLLKLGIGRISYGMQAEDHLDQRRYIRNHFFPSFTSLEMLKSPKEDFEAKDMEYITSAPECFSLPFVRIFAFHKVDGNFNVENGASFTTLKVLDMQSLHEPYLDSFKFIALAVASIKCGVELRNLRATCHSVPEFDLDEFLGRMGPPEPDLAEMAAQSRTIHNVTSILNIVPSFVYFICPNVKQVSIATCQWCFHNLPDPRTPMIQILWPRVETLKLNINSRMMGAGFLGVRLGIRGVDRTECFLQYLFGEPSHRPSVKNLKLSFLELQEEMPLPTLTSDIGSACPNLVKLELIGWKGRNESYWSLWSSLTKLEEIIIGKCERLGNRGFIGPVLGNNVQPLFLKLTGTKVG